MRSLKGHSSAVFSIAFSQDGARILSGSADKTMMLWDAFTGQRLCTFEGHTDKVASVSFSPDGAYALSGSWDKTLKLWDASTGKLVRTFEVRSAVTSVAFSPDGTRAVSGDSDGKSILWDTGTGQLVRTFQANFEILRAIQSVAFSPKGDCLLSGSLDKTMRLWDASSGKLLHTFEGHSGVVASVAFSPDGDLVLSGSYDTTIKLWDAVSGRLIRTFSQTAGPVRSAVFSPDSRRLISGSGGIELTYWNLGTGNVVAWLFADPDGQWLVMTPSGFFAHSSEKATARMLSLVRGFESTSIDQVHQSLFNPDLVREALANDPDHEVEEAAAVTNLDKVLDSGKAPKVAITSPTAGSRSADEIITTRATIAQKENSGVGRVEWRVNGITVGVSNPASGLDGTLTLEQTLALDLGDNTIEVVAYNGRNLLASRPAQLRVNWTAAAGIQPKLHVLAIGINKYIDHGGVTAGNKHFPPLALAVSDARALALELKKAGDGLYSEVNVRTVLDEEATAANLDAVVTQMAAEINPRDTFIFYAAAHGYSYRGQFYLIPQDYQGGPDPQALAAHAIDQFKLQDWIANRVKAKKALILLDTCESGALTSGYTRSRFEGPASDAAIGRLHEATGRPVLTAAAQGQAAHELTQLGHGVFTSALIDSLYRGDTNGDGTVSVSELVAHVQDLVPKLINDPQARAEVIRRGIVGGAQSARFGGRGEDFALARRLQ